jgi:AraC-like DNA-binding protein
MLDYLYNYLRGAIGFTLLIAGASLRMSSAKERGIRAFGGLYIAGGALFTMSALDRVIRLPVDIDNLILQAFLFVMGLSLLDVALFLFGSERHKGGRRILVRVGAVYEALLVLLPLLDYVLGFGSLLGNVEDSIERQPLHALAIEAGYGWPIFASLVAIAIARWKPADIAGTHRETHRFIVILCVLVPLLLGILAALALSIRPAYMIGHTCLELSLVAYYLHIVKDPSSLTRLRQEIGQEHQARSLKLGENEAGLIKERLARIEASQREAILDEGLNLKKLAGLIGVPPYRLSAYFGSRLSTSFPAWRNAIRISYVRERMEERPDISLLDISLEAGYRSKGTFNEQFSRIVGMSPSEYRRKLGERGGS